MGLDWNPGNRPRPGHESEFFRLFDRLRSGSKCRREAAERRLSEISISAFETLQTPQVGSDPYADAWALQVYEEQEPKATREEWLRQLEGFFVLDLVPECDGIPRYSNGSPGGYVESFSFRAEFLKGTAEIIGEDLLDLAWKSMTPDEMRTCGEQLLAKAKQFADANGIDLENLDTDNIDSIDAKLDIVVSAARWCLFWSERGHTLEAYW